MKTSKPLSAISYNTEAYLSAVCSALLKSGILSNWAYIRHRGEDGDKDHAHVLLFPARTVDTTKLPGDFLEAVDGETKPRGLVGLKQCASVVDWVRYSVHDTVYLRIKGEERQFHYGLSDIRVGSSDEWRAVLDEVRFAPLPCPSYQVSRAIIRDLLNQDPRLTWERVIVEIPFAPRDLYALKEYFNGYASLLAAFPSWASYSADFPASPVFPPIVGASSAPSLPPPPRASAPDASAPGRRAGPVAPAGVEGGGPGGAPARPKGRAGDGQREPPDRLAREGEARPPQCIPPPVERGRTTHKGPFLSKFVGTKFV